MLPSQVQPAIDYVDATIISHKINVVNQVEKNNIFLHNVFSHSSSATRSSCCQTSYAHTSSCIISSRGVQGLAPPNDFCGAKV